LSYLQSRVKKALQKGKPLGEPINQKAIDAERAAAAAAAAVPAAAEVEAMPVLPVSNVLEAVDSILVSGRAESVALRCFALPCL